MNETWFTVRTYGKIEPVEIIKTTNTMIYFPNGRREKQVTDWGGYFKTAQEAKDWRIRKAKAQIAKAEHELTYGREELAKAEALEVSEANSVQATEEKV